MNLDIFFNKDTNYTKTEQQIIDYLYQNASSFPFLTIGQLAKQLNVSEATVSRFARHSGYADFKEMRTALLSAVSPEAPAQKLSQTLYDNRSRSVADIFQRQQQYLEKTISYLEPDEIEKAVFAISNAKTIYLYGKGASHSLAELFAFRLNRFGLSVRLCSSGGSELFETMLNITAEDLVIIFGFQKTPCEAAVLLKHKQEIPYTTMLITSRLYHNEEAPADINLFVYRGENQEYHSMTTAMALIDALVLLTADHLDGISYEKLSELYRIKEKYKHDIPR